MLDEEHEPGNQADLHFWLYLLFVTLEKLLCKMGLVVVSTQGVVRIK